MLFRSSCLKLLKQYRMIEQMCSDAHSITLNEFPENLRCSNINGAMHKLLVGECLTGAKSVC